MRLDSAKMVFQKTGAIQMPAFALKSMESTMVRQGIMRGIIYTLDFWFRPNSDNPIDREMP